MSAIFPVRKFFDGTEVPYIGLGTFGSDKYDAERISNAVYGAVKAGYRMIDCASVYQNEAEIGSALTRLFEENIIDRQDLFITSKVWNDQHREVKKACLQSLQDLHLSYFDLYMVHWPFPNYHAPHCDGDSRSPDAKPFSVEEFMDTWRQMELLVEEGLVRHIAMSNMTISKLKAVLPLCKIQPAACELECHPAFQQTELVSFLQDHKILPIAFCPIGSPSRPERDRSPGDIAATEMPIIREIAAHHNIHPVLVCLKWSIQRGLIPIPFSVKPEQYNSNLTCCLTDPLTEEEIQAIANADCNCRLIKGQVFLWPGANGWEDLWDQNKIDCGISK